MSTDNRYSVFKRERTVVLGTVKSGTLDSDNVVCGCAA